MKLNGLPSTVMPKLAVTLTLTFDPKSNQHICEAKYMCDQNWVKLPSVVSEIWCSESFRNDQIRTSQKERPKRSMPPAPFSTSVTPLFHATKNLIPQIISIALF